MAKTPESSDPSYRVLVACLAIAVVVGIGAYGRQSLLGLGVTGMSRSVPWGLYISQFTFMVGIAASSVLVVLPRYVHGKSDGVNLVTIGETISVVALVEAMTFVLVDLGRPSRVLGVLLYAAPSSLMFWDILTLTGYLVICATILGASLLTSHASTHGRLRPLVLLSIPFAFGIHIVTALLYSGLSARAGWMSAVIAPKFLATAFASGSALLLGVARVLDRRRLLEIEPTATARLAAVMTYALVAYLLLTGLELFTALYSGISASREHVAHLFVPGHGNLPMLIGTAASLGLGLGALFVLLRPDLRRRPGLLGAASIGVFSAILLEKGLVFVPSGYFPTALGESAEYYPSITELLVACGIHAGGILAWLGLVQLVVAKHRRNRAEQTNNERTADETIGAMPIIHNQASA